MTPLETVNTFIERLCAFDLDRACELVAADVEYDNVPMGKNFGPQGIKDFIGPVVGIVTEMEFIIERETVTGNVVMNERIDRFVIGGKPHDLPVMGVFEVGDDGLITLWRDYFDMVTANELFAALAGGS